MRRTLAPPRPKRKSTSQRGDCRSRARSTDDAHAARISPDPLSHLVGLIRLGEVPALARAEDERDEGEVPAA